MRDSRYERCKAVAWEEERLGEVFVVQDRFLEIVKIRALSKIGYLLNMLNVLDDRMKHGDRIHIYLDGLDLKTRLG